MSLADFTNTLTLILLGICIGAALLWMFYRTKFGAYKSIASDIVQKAEIEAEKRQQASAQQQIEQQRTLEKAWQEERKKIQQSDNHLKQREDALERRMNLVEKKLATIERREGILDARKSQLEEQEKQTSQMQQQLTAKLEQISELTKQEAREHLLHIIQNDVKAEAARFIQRTQKEAEEESERKVSRILSTAINRLAVPCVSEATVNTVAIPNEEIKGRIIGREGRNIRTLERATGVNFLIDDTPGAIVLSCFDPIRLQIAKTALSSLIADGRIHPTRIEEAVTKATAEIKKEIQQHGQDAALRAGVMGLHPEIITLLGKLKYRYSYGQNILDHSLEVSHLMGIMAGELKLDVRLAKRIGLLHDMGKALTHEIEGTHAVIGHDFALNCDETKEVANGIGCHHHEMDPITVEGSLCSAADAISASRPAARIEAIESYTKRLRKLEDIAFEFPAVEKAYAMQAGKEIRIAVLPDMIDDVGTVHLARDLAKRIESTLSYPGKIKVTVIREKRTTEYAL